MKTLIKDIDSLVTMNACGKKYKRGHEMQDIGEIKNGAIFFSDKIEWVGTSNDAEELIKNNKLIPDRSISAKGKTILPGFVDSHTHIVFAGDRSDEFGRRLRGATYKEIADEGGGILHTVKATRNSSVDKLAESASKLAFSAMKHGTTAIEIKSGYGLSVDSELMMLDAINLLKERLPLHISSTFLGAHDFPSEYKDNRDGYVNLICDEMLPIVAERNLAEYCDAFIDEGYYTLEQGRKIFNKAKELGLKIKMHADELANVNAAKLAVEAGAVSADHLLFISDENINLMKNSETIATLLPGTAYFIRMPYAPARKLIDSGVVVAIATDCNPGSSFSENMLNILSLSAINMRMTAEEVLSASTINGAAAIGQSEIMGSLEPGKLANFIVADTSCYVDLVYHYGINHVSETWIEGKKLEFHNNQ